MTTTSCLWKKRSKLVTVDRVTLPNDMMVSGPLCSVDSEIYFCAMLRDSDCCAENCQPIFLDNNPRVSELNNIFAASESTELLVTAGALCWPSQLLSDLCLRPGTYVQNIVLV